MGKPFNLQSIRWHKTKQGWRWQYWNCRVDRWQNYTRQALSSNEARELIARNVYGVELTRVAVVMCENAHAEQPS